MNRDEFLVEAKTALADVSRLLSAKEIDERKVEIIISLFETSVEYGFAQGEIFGVLKTKRMLMDVLDKHLR